MYKYLGMSDLWVRMVPDMMCVSRSHRPCNYNTAIVAVWCKEKVQTTCAVEGVCDPHRVGGNCVPLWSQNSCDRYLQAHITSCLLHLGSPAPRSQMDHVVSVMSRLSSSLV